jgi:predicted MFS family arabinose efflux permease
MNARAWAVTLAAAALMALIGGGRSAYALFVGPLNTVSGIGLASFSLALALGQLGVGLVQPWVGVLSDRHGAARLIVIAAAALALFTALPAIAPLPGVIWLAVIGSAIAGCAVGSNGLLIGEVTRAVPPERSGLAVAIVGSGMSVGLLVLGPLTQAAIDGWGWAPALWAFAAASLLGWPLARCLRRPAADRPRRQASIAPPAPATEPAAATVRDALRQWAFWRVALSFGVCGFHVAFLAAHMPGVIERCGLPASLAGTWIALSGLGNVAGAIAVGLLLRRADAGRLLAGIYGLRALSIAALLLLPVSAAGMLAFALAMGATHMATLPPTSQLVARRHGVARLGALFGVVMLVHQVGSFAGIAFGGWAAEATGSDTLLWSVDIALALLAASLVWPWASGRDDARGTLSLPAGAPAT